MNSLKDTALESNPYFKINFDGGNLSSDAGLLLIKEFAEKIGLVKLVYRLFKTNDKALPENASSSVALLNNEILPSRSIFFLYKAQILIPNDFPLIYIIMF